tara:strand:+ start:599 stop:814 length:216 start_codon:yes stop_codon:yes gene_type:complete
VSFKNKVDRDRGTNSATGVSLDLSDNAKASDEARISDGASSNAQGSPFDIERREYLKFLRRFFKGDDSGSD